MGIKRDRFIRVAGLRVQRVLDSMESLAKCSNKGNYEYEAKDVKKMLLAIRSQVKNLEQAFGGGSESAARNFGFDK